MPLFYLNLHEGANCVFDTDGIERSSLEAVHRYATEAAREIMGAEIGHGRLPLSWYIEIQDEHREPLTLVPFADAVTIADR